MALDPFSAGYWLAPGLTVEPWAWTTGHAVVDEEVFWDLVCETGHDPVFGYTGGQHFEILPSREVPTGVCAVPDDRRFAARSGGSLMISKGNGRLRRRG